MLPQRPLVRLLIAVLLAAAVTGCKGIGTPSYFPNPIAVARDDVPPALAQQLRETYGDAAKLKVEFSPEAHLYGVTIPSGSIVLYDASGREVGRIL